MATTSASSAFYGIPMIYGDFIEMGTEENYNKLDLQLGLSSMIRANTIA